SSTPIWSSSHTSTIIALPRTAPLIPYTTLFRSHQCNRLLPGAQFDQRLDLGDDLVLPRVGEVEAERAHLRRAAPKIRTLSLNFPDRKSTRLNSSHQIISYAVVCLKTKLITSTVS